MPKRSDQIKYAASDKRPLTVQVVHKIKERILSQKIPVGESLPSERTMAKEFGVSRSVVREALRSIEQSGLVKIKPGGSGGAFVADNHHLPLFFSAYDLARAGTLNLEQFYVARRVNECASVREACLKATPEDLERLREINKRILADEANVDQAREDHRAFHLAIAEIAGNPLIGLIVHSLLLLLDNLCPATGRRGLTDMYKRHEAIIHAMELRDTALCESLMTLETRVTKELSTPAGKVTENTNTGEFLEKFKLYPTSGRKRK